MPQLISPEFKNNFLKVIFSWLVRFNLTLAILVLSTCFATAQINTNMPRNFLVLGDSIAAGFGVDPDESFPALLQQKVDQTPVKIKVINAGVSGDTTAGGLRRIDWLLKQRVDYLLLELGGNDGLRGLSPEATRSNMLMIIERVAAKNPSVKIVVAGMQMPPNMGSEYLERFAKVFPEVAKKSNATLIPFLLEGVGGKPELNLPDRIHPTPEGHRIITEHLWKTIGPLLSSGEPK